eukprot:scaffold196_cov371-Prasinococcus_capsulatus_cf.AAC.10
MDARKETCTAQRCLRPRGHFSDAGRLPLSATCDQPFADGPKDRHGYLSTASDVGGFHTRLVRQQLLYCADIACVKCDELVSNILSFLAEQVDFQCALKTSIYEKPA